VGKGNNKLKPNGKNPNDKDYIGKGEPPIYNVCSKKGKAKYYWKGEY